ncbi:TRAP transporter small permease subunit [Halomonas kalidii]|uniref:TRAP transporter small permease protein n=1 Tax=Halomonas kalidii TaxID=3043293 RepID=A0ABT6VFJ2_9GAMM|nr:TRAP transporter small permease subunit [Halomonas kalidii]MDI5932758.1 TRAP transporter small permease subunit [Halomonas kalidii]
MSNTRMMNEWFGRVVDGLNAVGSLLIFAMMVLVCADVASRSLLNQPIYGVTELMSLSIVAIVFLQMASTLRHRRMAKADIFIEKYITTSPVAGHVLSAVFSLGGILACALIVYGTYPLWAQAWHANEYIGVQGLLTVPTWPVKTVILIGGSATGIQYLIDALQDLASASVHYKERKGG